MARKTWQTKADWQAGIAENLEITDAGVKLARPEPAQFSPAGQMRYGGVGIWIEEAVPGVHLAEAISAPVPFTPAQGGEISFIVEVNDACKRQVANQYPALITMARANGGTGLTITHSPSAALFAFLTRNDANEETRVNVADSLIPNGTRELKIRQTLTAVILYCDGQPIAQIGNGTPETKPKLPSGWGRAYPLSSATGTYQAGTTVGNLRMVVG